MAKASNGAETDLQSLNQESNVWTGPDIPPSSQIPRTDSSVGVSDHASHDGDTDMQLYDQYDLSAFDEEEFKMLLDSAPADQLPRVVSPTYRTNVPFDLTNRLRTIRQDVHGFVLAHQFIRNLEIEHTVSARRAFERNVYDYARAKGLPKQVAKDEVQRARIICGERDYDTDETSLGNEIDDTLEILEDLASSTLRSSTERNAKDETNKAPKKRSRAKKRRRKSQVDDKQHERVQDNVQFEQEVEAAEENEDADAKIASVAEENQSVRKKRKQHDEDTGSGSHAHKSKKKRARQSPPEDSKDSSIERRPTNVDEDPVLEQVANGVPPGQAMTNVHIQPTLQANERAMLNIIDGQHTSVGDNDSPAAPVGGKAHKRQEKRNRRREKRETELKISNQVGTTESEDTRSTGENLDASIKMDAAAAAAADDEKVRAESRKVTKLAREAERKMAKHEKGNAPRVDANSDPATKLPSDTPRETPGHGTASTGFTATKKGKITENIVNVASAIGPNDPKSQDEARENFMRSNEHDPLEHAITPDKSPEQQEQAKEGKSTFIKKLGALKRFSKEKQVQLYEDGRYNNADKQTKNDLEDLKDEQIAIKETREANANSGNEVEKKRKRKRKTEGKAEKVKVEEDNPEHQNEQGGAASSDAKTKKLRNRHQEKLKNSSRGEESGFH